MSGIGFAYFSPWTPEAKSAERNCHC